MRRLGPGTGSSRAVRIATVSALVLVGVTVRVVALDQQGFWHDELYSVAHLSGFDAYVLPGSDLDPFEPPKPAGEWMDEMERDRFWATLERNLLHEGHPPFYQLGLKGWTSLFGRSVRSIRSFSLFPALLTIPILFLLGRHIRGPKVASAAAALIAVSPFHLYYSVEARNYAWAMMFSALALLAIVAMWRGGDFNRHGWLAVWWLAVLGASYTHYYAGLYCAVLLVLTWMLRTPTLSSSLKLGFPFVLFLPWVSVLLAQIDIHSAQHWTVGTPGLLEAGTGFIGVLLDQLTGVFNSATVVERSLAAAALLSGLWLLGRDPSGGDGASDVKWLFLSIPLYGVAVLTVDLTTNHHTILISRYLISVLPCLVLMCGWLATANRLIFQALLVLLILGNLVGAIETAEGGRAPKQALKEAGAFVADRYESGDTVLVTPSGPSLLGLVRYLPPRALVGAAPPENALDLARHFSKGGGTVWLARQNLGAPDELHVKELSGLLDKRTRFVAMDVIAIQGK